MVIVMVLFPARNIHPRNHRLGCLVVLVLEMALLTMTDHIASTVQSVPLGFEETEAFTLMELKPSDSFQRKRLENLLVIQLRIFPSMYGQVRRSPNPAAMSTKASILKIWLIPLNSYLHSKRIFLYTTLANIQRTETVTSSN